MSLSALQIKMVRRLLMSGTEQNIAHALEKFSPAEISIIFSELSPNETQKMIDSLCLVPKAGLILRRLPEFFLPDLLEMMDDKKLTGVVAGLEPDDALFLLEKMPEMRRRSILASLPPPQQQRLLKLLMYPPDTAGYVMTSNIVTVKADMTVNEAMESLRGQPDTHGIFYIYVVDEGNRLVGVQSLRHLILSQPERKVREIMTPNVTSVPASAPKEQAAQLISQHSLLALPVVSETGELVGAITVDDAIGILKKEVEEDIYHLAGLSQEDRATTPLFHKVRKRLPWMLVNLGTAFIASLVVGAFSGSIQKMVTLAVFLPIVAGVGGNGAIQSLTVITRSIALGELSFVKTYKAVLKETGNGLIIGLIAGILMGVIGYLWQGSLHLGFVLFVAMMLNLLMGGLVGAAVPILFQAFRLDPAVGTSVLVTLFTDSLGFFFFLGLATLMMGYLV